MPSAILTLGVILFIVGLVSYFVSHSIVLAAIICGIGYTLWVIGIIGKSVESSGEVNFG